MTTDTYRYSCRCGTNSPRFSSRKARSEWHADHVREGCPARRATSPRGLDWGDLDELQSHAERMRPLDPSLNTVGMNKPRDSSLDNWGRRTGSLATWIDVNCLRGCVATMLQRGIDKVPDPTPLFRSHGASGATLTTMSLRVSAASASRRSREVPARLLDG
jgi:hypothetical protein